MNCRECQAIVSEYQDGLLPADRRFLVEQHLHSCVDCRLVTEAEFRLDQTLQDTVLMAPPADFTRRVLARTGRQPWRARARSRWLTTFGCTGSGAALAVGLYQGLRPVGIELSSLRPPVTPADLTSGITSKASETLAGVADTVWGLGKTMAAAPPDWMASLSMSADAAAESPFVFILGASIAGLAVLSGILYATLGSSRAPA